MEFSRQEYWSRLPFPPPGDLPHPGIELASPALAGRFLTIEPPGKPLICMYSYMNGIPCREYSWKDYCDSLRGRGIQVAGDPADRETSHRVDIWLWILKLLHVLFSVQAIRLANIRMYTHTYTHARIYFLYMCLCINHIFNREICLLGSMNSWEFESSSSLERGVPGGAVVETLPASAGGAGDSGLIPGSGRSPGGHGSALQYSGLESSVDRGAWQATVHGVAKSWTQLSTRTH